MILFQSDSGAPPELMGFVSQDPAVGAYFGLRVFAGTPFEKAPVLNAQISVLQDGDSLTSPVEVGGKTIVCKLSSLGALKSINRPRGGMTLFAQQVLEADAGSVEVSIDGDAIAVTVAEVGPSGGAGALSSPAGIYSR